MKVENIATRFDLVSSDELHTVTTLQLDQYAFGIIGFGSDLIVSAYNAAESKNAGLRRANVVGKHLFQEVAPCMNNYMIAQRFADELEIDAIVPYVLTLRMKPTPVRLRLLKVAHLDTRFLLIDRKAVE